MKTITKKQKCFERHVVTFTTDKSDDSKTLKIKDGRFTNVIFSSKEGSASGTVWWIKQGDSMIVLDEPAIRKLALAMNVEVLNN